MREWLSSPTKCPSRSVMHRSSQLSDAWLMRLPYLTMCALCRASIASPHEPSSLGALDLCMPAQLTIASSSDTRATSVTRLAPLLRLINLACSIGCRICGLLKCSAHFLEKTEQISEWVTRILSRGTWNCISCSSTMYPETQPRTRGVLVRALGGY